MLSISCPITVFNRPSMVSLRNRALSAVQLVLVGALALNLVARTAEPFGDNGKLSSANPELKRYEVARKLMGVRFGFIVYAESREKAEQGLIAAVERVRDLDAIFSDYDPDSEVSTISRKYVPGKPISVSSNLLQILLLSDRVHRISDGAFDPTIGPLSQLWRDARKTKRFPPQEAIRLSRNRVGWSKLRIDKQASAVTFCKPGMKLDFGGIAKGMAADEALAVLRSLGLTRCLIDAAGDITVGDPPPGRDGWRIAIGSQGGIRIVLANGSVATSGDRFQFLEQDGKRYSHIINPLTGLGMTDRRRVTVLIQNEKWNGTLADSLASALSVMPIDRIREKIASLKNAEVCIELIGDSSSKTVFQSGRFRKTNQ